MACLIAQWRLEEWRAALPGFHHCGVTLFYDTNETKNNLTIVQNVLVHRKVIKNGFKHFLKHI